MNYFPFHIGDYATHTRHLSLMEDLAYRRMLDLYYTTEKPLPDAEKTARLIGMRDHVAEVSSVLADFFKESDGTHVHSRCESEIARYQKKADSARSANQKRWGSESDLKSDLKSDADQILTKNQEPRTKNHTETDVSVERVKTRRTTKCPETFLVGRDLVDWARAECPTVDVRAETAKFRDHTFANARSDWAGTWRNWMRKAAEKPTRGPVVNKQAAIEAENKRVAAEWLRQQREADAHH